MFAKDLDDRLTAHGQLSGPPPQQWEQFKTLVTESAKLTIGPKKKVHQDWFDEKDERMSWTTRRKPSSSGIIASPPLQNVTASNTSKGRPRRHSAECRTSGGRRRPTKLKPTLPQRTQKCSSAPSRKSTALPSHAVSRRLNPAYGEEQLQRKVERTLQYPAQQTLYCGPHCA